MERRWFIRDTADPERDLRRGFSGFSGSWFRDPAEAAAARAATGNPRPIRQDPDNGLWCADPEPGLSAFGFADEAGFTEAIRRLGWYMDGARPVAVFESEEYEREAGADGEDCFIGGRFLGWIACDAAWSDILALAPELTTPIPAPR